MKLDKVYYAIGRHWPNALLQQFEEKKKLYMTGNLACSKYGTKTKSVYCSSLIRFWHAYKLAQRDTNYTKGDKVNEQFHEKKRFYRIVKKI